MRRQWICLWVGVLIIWSLSSCSPAPLLLPNPTTITPQPSLVETPTLQSPVPIIIPRQRTLAPIMPSNTEIRNGNNDMTPVPSAAPTNPAMQQAVTIAKADLAKRLSISPDQIELVSVEAVTWSNGSLGCPQPGIMYTQSLVDGLRIQLRAGSRVYEYHSGGSRLPFLCEKPGRP